MHQATVDNPGFVIRQSWRHPVYILSHRDADDIAMSPSGFGDAQKFHDRLVLAAADVGLHVNVTKTKVLIRNHPWSPPLQVKNIDLDVDDDFNYPGSFIATTENYVKKLQGQLGSLTCRLLSRFAFTSVPFWVFLLMVGNMDSNWITVWQARHFPT